MHGKWVGSVEGVRGRREWVEDGVKEGRTVVGESRW